MTLVTVAAMCEPTQPSEADMRATRVQRVLVADDQPLRRLGLRMLLDKEPGLTVIADAQDHWELLAACQQFEPDLVLVDANLPQLGGLAATRAVREASPQTRVLIFDHEGTLDPDDAESAGATRVVAVDASGVELRSAVKAVRAGCDHGARSAAPSVSSVGPVIDELSPRELEVLALLARGYTNRQIAEVLVISHSTAKAHVEHILAKLRVRHRTEAAVRATTLGLIVPPPSHD